MKPTFFILGAAKAGTTSLYHYINQHPDVYMSEPKEAWFFDGKDYKKGVEWYWNRYFKGWSGQKAVGEASPYYLFLPYVPERIHKNIPDAKLIVILRNPVDRAYSHWWQHYVHGVEPLSFNDAILANFEQMKSGISFEDGNVETLWEEYLTTSRSKKQKYRIYLEVGHYAVQLRHYMELFSESQVKVVFLEDLAEDPNLVVQDVWSFLDVDLNYALHNKEARNVAFKSRKIRQFLSAVEQLRVHRFLPKVLRLRIRSLLASIGKGRPSMNPGTRSFLMDYYAEHNRYLEQMLQRNLSHWNR